MIKLTRIFLFMRPHACATKLHLITFCGKRASITQIMSIVITSFRRTQAKKLPSCCKVERERNGQPTKHGLVLPFTFGWNALMNHIYTSDLCAIKATPLIYYTHNSNTFSSPLCKTFLTFLLKCHRH